MDYKIQLLSFLFSFLFGILFSLTSKWHYSFVFHLKKWLQYLLTFLFILDISLFYVLILYYINNGVIHFYFIIMTFIGYASEKYLEEPVKKIVKSNQLFAKWFRK